MNRRSLPVIGLLVFLLSGCFRIELTVFVEDDGSGRIEGLLALDAGRLEEFGSIFGGDVGEAPSREELCSDFLSDSDVPEGATTEPYEEGDFCGVRFSQEFTADELDQTLAESFEDDTGDFLIERDGDGWRFEATLGDEATEGAEFFPQELFGESSFVIRVRLPGRQVEHNADRIESDGTMVWEVDPFNPGPTLMARTEPGDPITGAGGDDGGNTVLIIVLVVALAAVVAGAIFWWRKRSSAPAAGAATSEAVGPVDSTMPGTGTPLTPPTTGGPPPPPPPAPPSGPLPPPA